MWKKWTATALTVLMMTGIAAAEGNTAAHATADGWNAVEQNGVITVTDESGKEFARLDHEADEGVNSVLLTDDYNFDGKADLAALTSMGTANAYYTVWLRNGEGGFTEYPFFNEISAPRCNQRMRSIESFERVSAAEYVEMEYRWVDGELKPVLKRNIEYVDENGDAVQVVEMEPGKDGEILREWEMTSQQWSTVMELMDRAEQMALLLFEESAGEISVIYEGTKKMDGELYHVFPVELAGKKTGLICLNENNPQTALFDDSVDSVVNPTWQISPEGEKTERKS